MLVEKPKKYIILDFEINHTIFPGLDVIETGIIKLPDLDENNPNTLFNLSPKNYFSKLFKPRLRILKKVREITHIKHEIVRDKPYFWNEFTNVYENFIKNSVIIGHNITFDLKIIGYYYTSIYKKNFEAYYIDTLSLSKKYINLSPNYKLGTVANFIHSNLNDIENHHALHDCLLCHHILTHIHWQKKSLKFLFNNIKKYNYLIPPTIKNSLSSIEKKAKKQFSEGEFRITFYKDKVFVEHIFNKKLKIYEVKIVNNKILFEKTFVRKILK